MVSSLDYSDGDLLWVVSSDGKVIGRDIPTVLFFPTGLHRIESISRHRIASSSFPVRASVQILT